jgi:hypothetical protein
MAIDVSFSLIDDYARYGKKSAEGTDTVLATAITHAAGLLANWLAVTDCGCFKTTFSQSQVEDDSAGSGANKDAGGTLHVRLDNGKQTSIKIPAIKPSLVNPDGSIDITAGAITALVANYELAGYYRLSEGNYVTQILYGELDS